MEMQVSVGNHHASRVNGLRRGEIPGENWLPANFGGPSASVGRVVNGTRVVFSPHIIRRRIPHIRKPIRTWLKTRPRDANFPDHSIRPILAAGASFVRRVTELNKSVEIIDSIERLASLRGAWKRLDGGVPFRSFDWLTTWWKHYGQAAAHRRVRLRVLVVRDASLPGDGVVGIAPWCAEQTRSRGTVLHPLGDGEVCSDHLTILCQPSDATLVAVALAEHLMQSGDWSRIQLDAVDEGDTVVERLAIELASRDCATDRAVVGNCWSIDLPPTWDDFLTMQSKSHRKQLRRAAERMLATDRAKWHAVKDLSDFENTWPVFVELHQRRWRSLGEPGCFASRTFAAFHHEVAQRLLAAGRLSLGWLELDGDPVAAEYHLSGKLSSGHLATYAYQGGVDPHRLHEEPGRLANIITIQRAIEERHQRFDFLRGDEPYKAHWRARAWPTYRLRVLPPSHKNNWLAQTADWADSVTSALKSGLRPIVSPAPHAF